MRIDHIADITSERRRILEFESEADAYAVAEQLASRFHDQGFAFVPVRKVVRVGWQPLDGETFGSVVVFMD